MPPPLTSVFENDDLLVVDKPAGMPVHGGAGVKKTTVIESLHREHGGAVQLAHRLDQDTSGLLLCTKHSRAHSIVTNAWEGVTKIYLAIVFGQLAQRESLKSELLTKDQRGQEARTDISPLACTTLGDHSLTLIQAKIHTGRKHQIRRQLAERELPIVADDKYGDFGQNKAFGRAVRDMGLKKPKFLLLHAARLELPALAGLSGSDSPQIFTATYPERFSTLVAWPGRPGTDVSGT